jgi:2-oxoglutarate ferredoxin oxidoreductase subunit delta
METVKSAIEINSSFCKACYICIEFCPKNVLEMKGLSASVKNPDACIRCMQCEMRCPDFAIKVNAG